MTTFVVGKPVSTATPEVVVDAGLPIGTHRFRLVVVDGSGNASRPAEVVVQVGRVIAAPTDATPTLRRPVLRPVQPAAVRRKKT